MWTFKIRQGVKFHNGQPLTADDVVYTYQLQTNPKGESNALSAFGGVLPPAGVKKVDDFTVEFHLERPERELPVPDLLRQLQHDHPAEGLRPGQVGEHVPRHRAVQARLVHAEVRAPRSPATRAYWGTKALPSQTQFTFYDTQNPMILALTGGTIDVVGQFAVAGGEELLTGSYNIIKLKSSAHRQLSMRNDKAPFTDPRVRQAIALTLEPARRSSRRCSRATPTWATTARSRPSSRPPTPAWPSGRRTSPRPSRCWPRPGTARASAPSWSPRTSVEIPQYAQIVAQSAKAIGVNISLKVESSSQYYGKATFGNSDWLDATMSLVDYGHRGVPNVFLTSPLQTYNAKTGTGAWNAAHFSQRAVRQAGGAVHRRLGPGHAEEPRRADRDAAAGPDADHLRVLLQLPDGDGARA